MFKCSYSSLEGRCASNVENHGLKVIKMNDARLDLDFFLFQKFLNFKEKLRTTALASAIKTQLSDLHIEIVSVMEKLN